MKLRLTLLLFLLRYVDTVQGQCIQPLPISEPGKYFRHHVVHGLTTDTEDLCRIQCHLTDNCMSYNYNAVSGACEISDSDHMQDLEGLIEREGYKYVYSKNECAENPCPINTNCIAHISKPGYQCKCLCNVGGCRESSYYKCQRNYEAIGVMNKKGHFEELVLTYRRPCTIDNKDDRLINWAKLPQSIHSLACHCASMVEERNLTVFALEYYGNCWSNPVEDSDFPREDLNPDYSCELKNLTEECIGDAGFYYIYRLKDDFFQHLDVPCDEDHPVGMSWRDRLNVHITASSNSNPNISLRKQVRLESKLGAWSPKSNNQNEWLMINLREITKIVRISTQGHFILEQWVTSYQLSSSPDPDESTFTLHPKLFDGNTDRNTIVTNVINPAIENVQYIKILPQTFHTHISMRIQLYECKSV